MIHASTVQYMMNIVGRDSGPRADLNDDQAAAAAFADAHRVGTWSAIVRFVVPASLRAAIEQHRADRYFAAEITRLMETGPHLIDDIGLKPVSDLADRHAGAAPKTELADGNQATPVVQIPGHIKAADRETVNAPSAIAAE